MGFIVPERPQRVIGFSNRSCEFIDILRRVSEDFCRQHSNNHDNNCHHAIIAKTLKVTFNTESEEVYAEEWIKISGHSAALKLFLNEISKSRNFKISIIHKNRHGALIKLKFKVMDDCKKCLVIYSPSEVLLKHNILTPYGRIVELLSFRKSALNEIEEKMGYKIINLDDFSLTSHVLTREQERIIFIAYIKGYYSYPRKISLKDLAKELNISVTTLAEILRKAESKIVEMFLGYEMPHYMLGGIIPLLKKPDDGESKLNP